jgi:hypothetical protein
VNTLYYLFSLFLCTKSSFALSQQDKNYNFRYLSTYYIVLVVAAEAVVAVDVYAVAVVLSPVEIVAVERVALVVAAVLLRRPIPQLHNCCKILPLPII